MRGIIPDPPPIEDFEVMIRDTLLALLGTFRKIRQSALLYAACDDAWIPHLEFVEQFMRENGIPVDE